MPRVSMAAPCPLLGDGITDDTLLHIAGFLPTANDLLCFGLTNTRFSAKCIVIAASGSGISARDAVARRGGGAAMDGGLQRA